MIKRFRIWLKDLTLFQQFFAIGFLIITNLFIVFYMLLNQNLDNFINQQMYDYLHQAQNSYLSAYSNGYQTNDNNINHIFYDFKNDKMIGVSEIDQEIIEEIKPNYENLNFQDGTLIDGDIKVPFSLTRTNNENIYLISMIKSSYLKIYRQTLVSDVVHLNIIVLLLLFLSLTIWVLTIIRPLNQIKNYINAMKNENEAELEIKRGDEIGELASSVVEMNNELQKQNYIKQEMIQNISHDLKTPIATIKSYSEAIKDGIYPYETLEKSVDVIIEHAQRLENKVYNLINFNKLGYIASKDMEFKEVLMSEIINSVILGVKVLKNNIEIKVDLENVYFKGDGESWRILVENLIDNALRYAKSIVRIELKKDFLSVYNDGKHIENLDLLFKPYEKGKDGNFGLGLSIVKKVCDTYGYRVKVENLDTGVKFIVSNKNNKKVNLK